MVWTKTDSKAPMIRMRRRHLGRPNTHNAHKHRRWIQLSEIETERWGEWDINRAGHAPYMDDVYINLKRSNPFKYDARRISSDLFYLWNVKKRMLKCTINLFYLSFMYRFKLLYHFTKYHIYDLVWVDKRRSDLPLLSSSKFIYIYILVAKWFYRFARFTLTWNEQDR